jgi:hypothetical protein
MRLSTTCIMSPSASLIMSDTQPRTPFGRLVSCCWSLAGRPHARSTFDCTRLFDTILDRIAWHAEQNREPAKEMARDGLPARAVDVLPSSVGEQGPSWIALSTRTKEAEGE